MVIKEHNFYVFLKIIFENMIQTGSKIRFVFCIYYIYIPINHIYISNYPLISY